MISSPEVARRLNVRVEYRDPVLVHPISAPYSNRVFYMLAEDLSEGGLRLLSSEFIAIGTRLVLDIEVPNSPSIHIVGEVSWMRQRGTADQWYLGLAYTELRDEARARLRALVAERQSTE